jgi:hypothetical protein
VLDKKEIPESLTMVRTSSPAEVWPCLNNVMSSLAYKVVAFQITPSDVAEIGGYMYLYDLSTNGGCDSLNLLQKTAKAEPSYQNLKKQSFNLQFFSTFDQTGKKKKRKTQ